MAAASTYILTFKVDGENNQFEGELSFVKDILGMIDTNTMCVLKKDGKMIAVGDVNVCKGKLEQFEFVAAPIKVPAFKPINEDEKSGDAINLAASYSAEEDARKKAIADKAAAEKAIADKLAAQKAAAEEEARKKAAADEADEKALNDAIIANNQRSASATSWAGRLGSSPSPAPQARQTATPVPKEITFDLKQRTGSAIPILTKNGDNIRTPEPLKEWINKLMELFPQLKISDTPSNITEAIIWASQVAYYKEQVFRNFIQNAVDNNTCKAFCAFELMRLIGAPISCIGCSNEHSITPELAGIIVHYAAKYCKRELISLAPFQNGHVKNADTAVKINEVKDSLKARSPVSSPSPAPNRSTSAASPAASSRTSTPFSPNWGKTWEAHAFDIYEAVLKKLGIEIEDKLPCIFACAAAIGHDAHCKGCDNYHGGSLEEDEAKEVLAFICEEMLEFAEVGCISEFKAKNKPLVYVE